MLNLITDRTSSDVSNRTKKGYYTAMDLNRVTEAMEYLNEKLRTLGYESGYTPIKDSEWLESDNPTRQQMGKYLENVRKIRAAFLVFSFTPEAPESVRMLDYVNANNIEKILIDVESVIENTLRNIDLGWALGITHIGIYGGV